MIEPLPYLSQARLSRPALRALRPTDIAITPPGPRSARWFTTGQTGGPLTEHLRRLPYPRAGREADVVVLPRHWPADGTARLLRAYHHGDPRRPLTVVHHGAGGGSLLRGLAAADGRAVTTIAVPQPTPAALNRATGLLGGVCTADELLIDADGKVHTTGWAPVPMPVDLPALHGERVLVTGGLGGLGSRVALALAVAGAVPLIVDVRTPEEAPHATRRLLRLIHRHCPATRVLTADLTDATAAAAVLAGLHPSAIVHCAGRIAGGTGRALGAADIDTMIGAKVTALETVLDATGSGRLRALLTFGSLTAHGAHPGLSGYALANELLRRATDRFAARHPTVRCCTAEWSLWSGAGMARNVARQAARQLGMVPIPVATGVPAAVRLIGALLREDSDPPPASMMIMAERPGTQGAWSGRPEGVAGVEAALVVPAGADVTEAMHTVARAAAAGARVEHESMAHAPEPLLVRATVTGDRIDCVAEPASGAASSLHRSRYRLAGGQATSPGRTHTRG